MNTEMGLEGEIIICSENIGSRIRLYKAGGGVEESKWHFAQLLEVCYGGSIVDVWKGMGGEGCRGRESQMKTVIEGFGVGQ